MVLLGCLDQCICIKYMHTRGKKFVNSPFKLKYKKIYTKGALELESVASLPFLDRTNNKLTYHQPINKQTNIRVHREVTFQINVIYQF